jgi:CO/xanthine dehydrogenase FAD-binding subunit
MAAAVLECADGRIRTARIAVGACSPVARRLGQLEEELRGAACGEPVGPVLARHLSGLAPIDDVRGSASYRADAAVTLLQRLLEDLLS